MQALALAEPRGPGGLGEPDAGAVLALACHCVMVDNGFLVSAAAGCAASYSILGIMYMHSVSECGAGLPLRDAGQWLPRECCSCLQFT